MKLLYKYIAIFCLTIPNSLFEQSFTLKGDSILIGDSVGPTSSIAYCSDRRDKLEKPIRLDWVQIDVDIIRGQLINLPANSSTLRGIKKLIPRFLEDNYQSITQDLGYGLKSTLHTIRGGYGSCNVDDIHLATTF